MKDHPLYKLSSKFRPEIRDDTPDQDMLFYLLERSL